MKTYISDKEAKEGVKRLNEVINVDELTEIRRIRKQYDLHFTRNARENQQRFWTKIIGRLDALPETDKFRRNLIRRGEWEGRSTKTIFDFMDYIECAEDYSFVKQWEPHKLGSFTESVLPNEYHIHGMTLDKILEIGDYAKFFNSYLKKNCDKNALAETTKIKAEFDSLLKGIPVNERHGIVTLFNTYAFVENIDFDILHHLIHTGE